MIAGLLTWLGAGQLGRAALRIGLLVVTILLLLLACRRSGERLGRLAERLETAEKTMTCSGNCWRRRLAVLAIATSLLAGCGMAGSDRHSVTACPPVIGYSAKLHSRAAAEVDALSEGSAVADLLSDYAVMREQARSCAAG